MAIGSIIIGVVALLFMVAGFFFTAVPVVGSIMSFGSPILALVGIVMAGVAMSRAKQQGESNGAAVAGLVVSIVAFILGTAVALTCGLCNACMTSGMMNQQNRGGGMGNNPFLVPRGDGGPGGGSSPLGQSFAAEASRISLAFTLAGVQMGCAGDPSGASTANNYHPQVASQYQAMGCTLTDQAVEAYGRGCSSGQRPCSEVAVIAGTPDAQRATALGLDAGRCYAYTSGQGKVIGCTTDQGFKLIHLENVNAVQ